MNYSSVKKIADQIPGWLTNGEGKILFDLASKCNKDGIIVEIGSWKGKSTAYIGNAAINVGAKKVYSIDPHIGSEDLRNKIGHINSLDEFKKNCNKSNIEDIVEVIVDFSYNSVYKVEDNIQFIFIDGDHSYAAVKQDMELWFPKVAYGGVMAFHDTTDKGPGKVTKDSMYFSRNFCDIHFVDSITYGTKCKDAGILGLFVNLAKYIFRESYFIGFKYTYFVYRKIKNLFK